MLSVLTKSQKKVYERRIGNEIMVMTIDYDDSCNNGHNSFGMTASIYEGEKKEKNCVTCGCCHEEIKRFFPEYAKYIKWHLCSSNEPMYYIENTVYHASKISKHEDKWYFHLEKAFIRVVDGKEKAELIKKYGIDATFEESLNAMAKEPDLEAARDSAIWQEGSIGQLRDKKALMKRLPALMQEFKKDMEELGFIY